MCVLGVHLGVSRVCVSRAGCGYAHIKGVFVCVCLHMKVGTVVRAHV